MTKGLKMTEQQDYINSTKNWLEQIIIELNLCPFAKREFLNNSIHFTVSSAVDATHLLEHLQTELERLDSSPEIQTTLLIHPKVLDDFLDYNDFLELADELIQQLGYEGIYQIASFHPDYQFSDTQAEDAENYTNRSPFPLLHILREEALEKRLSTYPNPEQIPERNIALMNTLGPKTMQAKLAACINKTSVSQ